MHSRHPVHAPRAEFAAAGRAALATLGAVVLVVLVVIAFDASRSDAAPSGPVPVVEAGESGASSVASPAHDAEPGSEGLAAGETGSDQGKKPGTTNADDRALVEPELQQPHPVLATVTGSVVDEAGAPLSGVFVSGNVNLFPIVRQRLTAETDAAGVFTFADIPAGRVGLEFHHDDRAPAQSARVDLESGVIHRLEPIVLAKGAEVDGYIWLDGKPFANAQLWVMPLRGNGIGVGQNRALLADATGHFKVPGRLAPGRYRVILSPVIGLGMMGMTTQPKSSAGEFDLGLYQSRHTVRLELSTRR